jgi:integrase/recombinase XerD
MPKKSTRVKVAGRRHRDAPFLAERERYLCSCAECGATSATLAVKRSELIWTARLLPATAPHGIDIGQLRELVRQRALLHWWTQKWPNPLASYRRP